MSSLVQSAKLNGHDASAYLRDVLERLPGHPNSRIEALLPRRSQKPVARSPHGESVVVSTQSNHRARQAAHMGRQIQARRARQRSRFGFVATLMSKAARDGFPLRR